MEPHTRIYMQYFGYQIPEDFISEISGQPAHDIHHIHGRGRDCNRIENLMALTRDEHNQAHAEKISKAELQDIHDRFMKQHNRQRKVKYFK